MDLSFGRRQIKRAAPAPLDYAQLIAMLASVQGASRTAQVAGRLLREHAARSGPAGGLVALLDARCDWIAAAAALGGSFNPRVARCRA